MDFQLGPGLSSDQARHVILVSGAIFVATALLPQSSYAGCTGGNQKTCTGNLLGGANFDAPVTNVTVNGLTGNIAPAVGTRGISLVGGAPTLDVDLGGRTVTVRGTNVYQGGLAGIGAWGANRVNVGAPPTSEIPRVPTAEVSRIVPRWRRQILCCKSTTAARIACGNRRSDVLRFHNQTVS